MQPFSGTTVLPKPDRPDRLDRPRESIAKEGTMFEIMIDTGGTFTDGVLIDDKQNLSVAKAETQPQDPARSILNCIARLAEERNMTQEELLRSTSTVTIGTTLPTNCILEGKGAKCCLIHTKGFRDVFELGRTIPKTDIYNLKVVPPRILIPRYLRFGVEERLQYDGAVVTPLKESDVRKAVRQAKAHGVEVPVICFLHSYVNPVHEEQAAEIIKADYPNVVVSSRILRRWIEYDRASTATYAAYVKPLLTRFMEPRHCNRIGPGYRSAVRPVPGRTLRLRQRRDLRHGWDKS
jgi:N-methylhydantoinase A